MVRVVHYINQFFGQIGGEEKTDVPPSMVSGAVGPGILIDKALQGRGKVVATVICGDTYFTENTEEAAKKILTMVEMNRPDILLAGPRSMQAVMVFHAEKSASERKWSSTSFPLRVCIRKTRV